MLGLLGALVLTTSAASADQTVVVGGDDPSGPNPYLFGSGVVMLGVSYAPALAVAINSNRSEDDYLYAPVVGPWLDLASRDCANACGNENVNKTLLVVDGVFQAVGALQIMASLMFIDSGADTTVASSPTVVSPARFATGEYGLVAAGHF
jgi:hypothetical protein